MSWVGSRLFLISAIYLFGIWIDEWEDKTNIDEIKLNKRVIYYIISYL